MKKAPKTRFSPFQEEWASQRFADAFTVLPNNTLSRAELSDEAGTVKNVHYGDVLIKFGEYLDAGKTDIPFIASEGLAERWKSAALQDGDVVMADTAEDTTAGKCTEIGNVRSDTIVSGLHTIPLHPQSKFSEGYLGYYMNSDAFHDQLIPLMQGTKVTSISKTYLADTKLRFPPDSAEQAQIARLLYSLDQMITSQQRKCEKLIALKAACLDKMFPKKGSKTPELRFAGFVGEWEQNKLSDEADVYDGVHQTPDYKKEGIMFLSVENITTLVSDKYISVEDFERDYKVYPEKGDILMTRIGDIGTPNVVETKEKVAFYVSLALLKPHEVDSYFLNYSIQSPSFQHGLRDRSLLTAIPMKINKDEIGKVLFCHPRDEKEQRAIGEYFKQLDTLVTLHQRKLTKLQEFKQAMIHNMFV